MRLGTVDGRREIEDRRSETRDRRCDKGYVIPEARDKRQETVDRRKERRDVRLET